MDGTAMRIETFLIAEWYDCIFLALFIDIKGKHFGLICSNIKSIVVYLNTADVLYMLKFDFPEVLGEVQKGICREVLT